MSGRSSELFNRDNKPDSLDIRAVTSASRGRDGKRQKYRMHVTKADAAIFGSKLCPNAVDKEKLPQDQLFIEDPRAPSLNLEYSEDQYRCMPSSERFSAHTGICQILGSKSIRGGRHKLQVGDIIRFGSVGLLVSEIDTNKTGNSDDSMNAAAVAALIQKVINQDEDIQRDYDSGVDTDEEAGEVSSDNDLGATAARLSNKDETAPPMCYVCYEEGEDDNPLVSPCKCIGDTKYIHISCLKRWNTGDDKNDICAILDETNLRKCTICKTPYPSKTKLPSGDMVSLLPDKLNAPSITFVVVTKHSSTTMTTNMKFQLSLSSLMASGSYRHLLIGRSSQCDMILKYRTVSTVHAELHYVNGEFLVQDVGSSNGTLRYLYKPLVLRVGHPVHLKFGRTVVSLKAKRRLRLASFFSGFSSSNNQN